MNAGGSGAAAGWEALRGSRRKLALGLGLGLAQVATTVPAAGLVSGLVDRGLAGGVAGGSLLALALLALATVGLGTAQRLVSLAAIKTAGARLRARTMERIQRLPKAYFDRNERIRLHDLAVRDMDRFEGLVAAVATQLGPNLAVAGVIAVVLATKSGAMLVTLLTGLVPVVIWSRWSHRRLQAAAARSRVATGAYNRGVIAGLRQVELTRLHGNMATELAAHEARIEVLREETLRSQQAMVWHQRGQQVAVGGVTGLVLLLGGAGAVEGRLSAGALMGQYVLAGMMLGYLKAAAAGWAQVVTGREALAELDAFWRDEAAPPYAGRRVAGGIERVVVHGVDFAYAGAAARVLRGVELTLTAGRSVALWGPNGSGKSTLVNLVLGFYRPQAGRLTVDGVPYEEIDLEDFRRRIGVVPQEPLLLTGTARENIRCGLAGASAADVEAAARAAGAHEFLTALPRGYDTEVGEHGARLSGGQKQRLVLARALVRRPRLLVLDEPTNHLDAEAVAGVVRELAALRPAPAVLLVTHDRELAAGCDEVAELRDGRLVRREEAA